MLSVNFSGGSVEDVAREARQFADSILGKLRSDTTQVGIENRAGRYSYDGYRPDGVGKPELDYAPVDDGREWNEEAIRDWVDRLTDRGREVVGLLARKKRLFSRDEARGLEWPGTTWAGVWTGPRRQALHVRESRELNSWPYGHTYQEPRQFWMHEDIAARVLSALSKG